MLSLTLRCGAEYFLDGLLVETILSNLGATDLAAVAATCSSLRRPCEAVAATSLRLLLVRMQTEPVRAELVRGAIARLMLWELIAADCHLWLQADERYLTLAERFGTSYVQACADRSGSGHGAYSHLNGPEFLPDALHGCGVFLFDGAAVLKTRPFTEPIPQPITLMVVAKARGDTTIIDALGTSSSRFELCHGYPTGWHPSPEICITASGHDASPKHSLRGATRGTGEWHIYTAVFDTKRSEIYVDGFCEATGNKSVGSNLLDGLSIGCDHNGIFFLIGCVAELRLFRRNLSTAHRVQIEASLARRYGLAYSMARELPSPTRQASRFTCVLRNMRAAAASADAL